VAVSDGRGWVQKKRLLGSGPASGMYSRMPPSQSPSRSRASGAVTASMKWRRPSLVRRSAAVAVVPLGCGAGDLGGDGCDGAVVCGAAACGVVVEETRLRGPWRADGLAEQAADVGGDAGRVGPARRPLEHDLAGGAVSQGCDGARIGPGQVVGDDDAVRGGPAGVEVRRRQAEHRGGRGAEDLAGAVRQQRYGLRGGAGGVEDQPEPPQRGRAAVRGVAEVRPAAAHGVEPVRRQASQHTAGQDIVPAAQVLAIQRGHGAGDAGAGEHAADFLACRGPRGVRWFGAAV